MTTSRKVAAERGFSVWLHGNRVGALYSRENLTRFVLEDSYIEDPQRAVLGLRFEEDLHATHRANLRLPPWFSNLLPEGLLRQWVADARGVSKARELELLLQLGRDLPGAVVVTEGAASESESPKEREIISPDPPLSNEAAVWRFSLAGVAMKFSMLKRGDRFTAPAVGDDGDWIVKLPDPTYPQVPLNEFSMMELARLVGLDVPETLLVHRDRLEDVPGHLWPNEEQQAYAVKRFDRSPGGGRVHMEDLAQVRGFYPEDKYRGSFETIAALIYRGRDESSLIEFCKRLAFNVLIRNGDAHLKNWSLLYVDPRIPSLSPAYDLVATSVYRPSGEPEDLGLKFGRNRRFEDVSLALFAHLERRLGIQKGRLTDAVSEFVGRAREALPEMIHLIEEHEFLLDGIVKEFDGRANALAKW